MESEGDMYGEHLQRPRNSSHRVKEGAKAVYLAMIFLPSNDAKLMQPPDSPHQIEFALGSELQIFGTLGRSPLNSTLQTFEHISRSPSAGQTRAIMATPIQGMPYAIRWS